MQCQICLRNNLQEASKQQFSKAKAVIVCDNEFVMHYRTSHGHFLLKKHALEEILDTTYQKELILN